MTAERPADPVLRLRPDAVEPLTARLLGAGPHLEPVLDVGRAPNGDLLVVGPVPAARLPDLVAVPGWPTAGEAVTVLVPLAQALARLHAAGVAHGGVGAAAVRFDADGAPWWTGPDAPVLRARVGEEAYSAAVAADVAAFAGLLHALLGPAGARVPDRADLLGTAAALFGIAEPAPVRLRPAPASAPSPTGPPSRLLPAVDPAPVTPGGVAERLRPVVASLRAVRRRVWLAAGAVAVLLVAVPVLLPSGRPVAAPLPSAAALPTSRAPIPSTASPRATPPPTTLAPTLGPEAALRALLAARARCLAAGSERCLAGVDAAGSPVLVADLAAVRAGTDAVRADPARARIRSTGGGTTLADVGGVTVLAVREPGGWRLRDVAALPSP